MKRILSFIITIALILSLSSCFFSAPWDEGKLKDTFFSEETLIQHGLEELPTPKLEGSYLDEEENILYLDLTREEYAEYAKAVVDYLRAKEGLTVSGYLCEKGIFGLLIIPIPEYKFAPLDDGYTDYSRDSHSFVFSKEYIEYYGEEIELEEEEHLTIKWNPTDHGKGLEHTVEVELGGTYMSKYLPCYNGHNMKNMTYPVPGTVDEVAVSTCKVCGEQEMDKYVGADDTTLYSVSADEDSKSAIYEYVIDLPNGGYAGTLNEVIVPKIAGATVRVSVNGVEIPLSEDDGEYLIYGFIMPCSDVVISVEVTK